MRAQLAQVGEGKVRFADPLAEEVQRSVTGVGPHLAIGHIAPRAGDLEGAAERFGSALEADPDSPQAHHAMALLLDRQGRSAEALAELDRAAALAPREPELARAAAAAHLRAGDDWAAIGLLRAAAELAPDYRTLLDLAMALERTGNLAHQRRHPEVRERRSRPALPNHRRRSGASSARGSNARIGLDSGRSRRSDSFQNFGGVGLAPATRAGELELERPRRSAVAVAARVSRLPRTERSRC